MKMWRQGDCLIIERAPMNPKATRVLTPDKVLIYGEATGHAHRVVGDTAKVFDIGAVRFIEAAEGFSVQHEEHATIELPAGTYFIRRQREYDSEEVMRYVAD